MKPTTRQFDHLPVHGTNVARIAFQRGLSLIELMISITIGLIILVALSTLFMNQSKARIELDKSNRMIDNGRYALEILSNNLSLAGFYDNYAPFGAATQVYDPCLTTAITDTTIITDSTLGLNIPKNLDILRLPVYGYDAATPTSQIPSPPCGLTYTPGSDLTLKAGSDILVVRRANTTVATSAASSRIYLQVSMCPTDTAAPPFNYQLATAPASFSNLHQKDCATPANLRLFNVYTYFVSPNDKVVGGVGDNIPTLKQIDQYGNVTPLVEGIEYLQIEYGLDDPTKDSNGDGIIGLDGIADSYSSCAACSLTDWSNVVSVKVNILARNTEATNNYTDNKTYPLGVAGSFTPNDNYKRHAFTQYIRLVNPAGRREIP